VAFKINWEISLSAMNGGTSYDKASLALAQVAICSREAIGLTGNIRGGLGSR